MAPIESVQVVPRVQRRENANQRAATAGTSSNGCEHFVCGGNRRGPDRIDSQRQIAGCGEGAQLQEIPRRKSDGRLLARRQLTLFNESTERPQARSTIDPMDLESLTFEPLLTLSEHAGREVDPRDETHLPGHQVARFTDPAAEIDNHPSRICSVRTPLSREGA